MTEKEARNLSAKYFIKYNSIAVTSDGSVYLNSDIEKVKKDAKKNGLKVFITKDNGTK
jgi:hypothetical protein